jgi:hypothetical protein
VRPLGLLQFYAGQVANIARPRTLAHRIQMAELSSLESLQALYTDLLALSEKRLSSIERLGVEIEAHIRDFKNLLDKKPRNEQSRQSLGTGMKPLLHSFVC